MLIYFDSSYHMYSSMQNGSLLHWKPFLMSSLCTNIDNIEQVFLKLSNFVSAEINVCFLLNEVYPTYTSTPVACYMYEMEHHLL